MAANKLALLVGDYQSDSNNDDSVNKRNKMNDVTTDWTQCTHASSGHPYYWNIKTKDVTWEMPVEYQLFLEQAMRRNSYSMKKWILCYTDDSAPYYFNEVTREISWEKPEDFDTNSSNNNSTNCNKSEPGNSNIGNNDNTVCATTKAKLNLVPEYNSDESDDENVKPSQKPLFPSSSNAYPVNNQHIKTIEIPCELSNDKTSSDDQAPNSPKKSEQKQTKHKTKQSFASIITGGRSPQHETVDLKQFISDETDETSNPPVENANAIELSQKTFQRKRRIEFNVSNVPVKRTNQQYEPSSSLEPVKEAGNSIENLKAKYGNFQKGETEFMDKQSPATVSVSTADNKPNDTSDIITDEQQLLEAKLNFLCQGRTDVSPVQIIQIQLQTLQAAHVAEALHSDYLLEWMKNISNDLIKLESDAAPTGWKCLWNREKAQYCYENTTTGEIQWEYPDLEVNEPKPDDTVIADDAMDICTTPPPNEHEDLSAAFYQTNEYHAADSVPPPPPKWTSEPEKPLDDELASFYSDIAKLEPEGTNDENSCDKSPSHPDTSVSPDHTAESDAEKKKKKKKPKKLEPWRSGNLETWINKWQKAQKELDG